MKRRLIVLAVVLVAILGIGAWWFFGEDTPERVSLDKAVQGVDAPSTTGDGSTSTGVDGAWTLDTSTGSFDYKKATGSFVGFRVGEELANIGNTEAVGRTGDVTGSLTIGGTSLKAAKFTVQMGSITTDRSMRDQRVHGALDVAKFPTSTFTLTGPVDFGDVATTGKTFTGKVAGDFTLHGVTKQVTAKVDAVRKGETIVVVGSFEIDFADYGVSVPSSPVVVSANDHGTIEFQLLFTRG